MILQSLSIAGMGIVASVLASGRLGEKTHTRLVRAGDHDIFYYDRGTGPVLLLIHGMFGDFTDWEPILQELSRGHRVVALDLPGFGASSKPKIDYTTEFFVGSLDAFLVEVGIEKATFVGNSFGGIICMLYSLHRPERVQKLVLVDSGGFHRWTAEERADAERRFRPDSLRKLSPERHRQMFNPLFVKGPSGISASYIAKQDAKLCRDDFDEYVHSLNSSVQLALDNDVLDRLNEITPPTLLIQGEEDRVMRLEWAQAAVTKFPNAELLALPGCGHVPQLECGPEVVRMISEFVARE